MTRIQDAGNVFPIGRGLFLYLSTDIFDSKFQALALFGTQGLPLSPRPVVKTTA
jgi:hypothetical protein